MRNCSASIAWVPSSEGAGSPRNLTGARACGIIKAFRAARAAYAMFQTLYDKLWSGRVVHAEEDGTTLVYIDRHIVHEVTGLQAFEGEAGRSRRVAGCVHRGSSRTEYAEQRLGQGSRSDLPSAGGEAGREHPCLRGLLQKKSKSNLVGAERTLQEGLCRRTILYSRALRYVGLTPRTPIKVIQPVPVAGFEWREAGCSMCPAMNADRLEAGSVALHRIATSKLARAKAGARIWSVRRLQRQRRLWVVSLTCQESGGFRCVSRPVGWGRDSWVDDFRLGSMK